MFHLKIVASLVLLGLSLVATRYLRADLAATSRSPTLTFLCEFISSTNIKQLYPEWKCSKSEMHTVCTTWTGITCDNNDFIVAINIVNSNISGTIPDSIQYLTNLTTLNLSRNSLTDYIPSTIGSLVSLVVLDLSDNYLSGTIPQSTTSLSSLSVLNVCKNTFYGRIPSGIGNMISLTVLDASDNLLSGTIPNSITRLTSLMHMKMSFCWLDGSIPRNIGNMKSLTILDLSENYFMEGSIPYSLVNLTSLMMLNLARSSLSGSIPDDIGNMKSLTVLDLSKNYGMDGSIPESIFNLTSLSELSLVSCGLSGSISDDIGNMKSLTVLDLSSNWNMDGSIPESIFNMNALIELSLAGCGLSGSISDDIGNMKLLTVLDLSGNYNMDGSIPHSIVNLTSLMELNLGSCSLSGSIPEDLGNMKSLTVLDLSSNRIFDGSIPEFIFNLTALMELDLASCSLSGSISEDIGNMKSLTVLDLSYNHFDGSIPNSIANLSSMQSISLHYSQLTGPIPAFELNSLHSYSLYENFLTGTLPTMLAPQLTYLDLYFNFLSGSISHALEPLVLLRSLDLSVNSFEGLLSNNLCYGLIDTSSASVNVKHNRLSCFESCWLDFDSDHFLYDPSLDSCAPSIAPTVTPSVAPTSSLPSVSPSFSPTTSPASAPNSFSVLNIIVIVVGAVICLILVFVFLRWRFRSRIVPVKDLALMEFLNQNPVFNAIMTQENVTPEFLAMNSEYVCAITPGGQSIVEIALSSSFNYSELILFTLLQQSFPASIREDTDPTEDCMNGNTSWAYIIQRDDELSMKVVNRILTKYLKHITILANATDKFGRLYVDIASPKCKELIKRKLYLDERYELFQGPPVYKTSTSVIMFAYDHNRIYGQSMKIAPKVAMKFMRFLESLNSETIKMTFGADSSKFIISSISCYNGDTGTESDTAFRQDAIVKGFKDYPYCVVMEAGEQNLNYSVTSQRIAGNEWDAIRRVFKQLTLCVQFIHSCKVIHGDLKPNNVLMLSSETPKLIDFDSAMMDGTVKIDPKLSTVYCAPECLELNDDGTVALSRKLVGKFSLDLWSLGAILYWLCTGTTLFPGNIDDNILDKSELLLLYEWDDETRDKKFSQINDHLARNLVSLLLHKDPEKRMDTSAILQHPFLTGKQSVRLKGQMAEYDVFISYRVSSDLHHAKTLYEKLTARGLRVWWDKASLEFGTEWQKAFCRGLAMSESFVCIISEAGMGEQFKKLDVDAVCDNVLLEHRLALELKEIGHVKYIFPIMVGENSEGMSVKVAFDETQLTPYKPTYNESRKHVKSVEKALNAHLNDLGLGSATMVNPSVYDVACGIRACNGFFIGGDETNTYDAAVDGIVKALSKGIDVVSVKKRGIDNVKSIVQESPET